MKRVVYRGGVRVWLAAVVVLSLGSVTVVEAQGDEERLFWESVRCHEEKEVRLYLEEYPKGAYVEQAIQCLQDIGDSEQGGDDVALRDRAPELVRIEGGCFQMGSPADEAGRGGDERQHRVCVEDFSIGKHEVTQAQWESVMGGNPSIYKAPDRPVEQVSWHDVQDYIDQLNAQTDRDYHLPTEAEWEYACRSGGRSQRYCGGEDLDGVAWYTDNSDSESHPVGRKRPNGLELYDMSGNVYEWTCSTYDKGYEGGETRCVSRNADGDRVARGGSWWLSSPRKVRSANRHGLDPNNRYITVGFRLAQD